MVQCQEQRKIRLNTYIGLCVCVWKIALNVGTVLVMSM